MECDDLLRVIDSRVDRGRGLARRGDTIVVKGYVFEGDDLLVEGAVG